MNCLNEAQVTAAIHRAIAKRDRIIEREGDMNGARWELRYLEELIAEELRAIEAMWVLDGNCLVLTGKAI